MVPNGKSTTHTHEGQYFSRVGPLVLNGYDPHAQGLILLGPLGHKVKAKAEELQKE